MKSIPAPMPNDSSPDQRGSADPPIDVLVATYNSAETLEESLLAVRRALPVHCLIVLDRSSTDETVEIARRYGAKVETDGIGLGYARNTALRLADTDLVLFVDSDVIIVRPDFLQRALMEIRAPRTAAVVGLAVGHRFRYGLPLGLTLLARKWALDAGIPDSVQGRETYYLQRAARAGGFRVRYVVDAMIHRGVSRNNPRWPEFQGASIRQSSGWNPRELVYAAIVVLLMHMNSRNPRNILYSPIFLAKLLRGFLAPNQWGRLVRIPTNHVEPRIPP